jgi:hypothetical protein
LLTPLGITSILVFFVDNRGARMGVDVAWVRRFFSNGWTQRGEGERLRCLSGCRSGLLTPLGITSTLVFFADNRGARLDARVDWIFGAAAARVKDLSVVLSFSFAFGFGFDVGAWLGTF